MAAYNKFEAFTEHLCEKVHNLDADLLKVYLSNTTPSAAADAVKADLAEITGQNGYDAGGHDTQNATSRTGGTTTITAVDIPLTATGGSFGPFEFAVLYNDTPASGVIDPLIGWWVYPGGPLTVLEGESLTIDFAGNALLQVA